MAGMSGLLQRNGRWYFNRAYPKDLWGVLGSAPFRRSLGTDSHDEAQRRRATIERLYWAKVDEARGRQREAVPRALSNVEAEAIVSRWLASENALYEAYHIAPGTPLDAHAEALENSAAAAGEFALAVGQNDLAKVAPVAERILAVEGINADPVSPGYRLLLQLLLRGTKELLLIDVARMQGDFGYQPSDPAVAKALTTPRDAPKRTLADLEKAYRADKQAAWAPSTASAYIPVFRLLLGIAGANRDVATITRADGRDLFEAVKALPRGLGRAAALRGLTVPQAIARGRELGLPLLAPKSINDSYLTLLGAVFLWAVNEQWLPANPMTGLSVADPVADADKRDPFSSGQLASLFGADPWQCRAAATGDDPLRFWGPLLALFHGMRRGEIAQLGTNDVEQVEGFDVIVIRPGDGRRVKTAAGRRMLPVHPELIRMGFPAFANRQRRAGHAQLFPGETVNANGQWGDGLSDWFGRLLAKRGIVGTLLGMHSLRRSYQDRLREAGLHGTAIGQELTGRAKAGDVSSDYGSGFSTRMLAEAVAKLTYPGLEFTALYVTSQP